MVFGPKAAQDTQSIFYNLERVLNGATASIRGSIHEFDMIRLAEQLAAAKRRGVDVQMVVESKWWDLAKNAAARETLVASGVVVTPDSCAGGFNHHKFLIIDAKRVWTGSTNLTGSCLFYNLNTALLVENQQVVANFESEFADQAAGKFGARKTKRDRLSSVFSALGEKANS